MISLANRLMLFAGKSFSSALVAMNVNGEVFLLDISNPANISLIGYESFSQIPQPLNSIVNSENGLVYVADVTDDALHIIDISQPPTISLVFELDDRTILDFFSGLAADFSRNLLFGVAGSSKNLLAFDITNPSSPTLISYLNSQTNFWGSNSSVVFTGTLYDSAREILFVAAYTSDMLTAVDVSDPNSMSVLGSMGIDAAAPIAADFSRDVVFTASLYSDYIYAIDVSNPSSMTEISCLHGGDTPYLEYITQLIHDDANNLLFCLSHDTGHVTLLDTTNTSSLSVVGHISFTTEKSYALEVDFENQVFYSADTEAKTISAYDYSDPTQITLLGTFTHNSLGRHVLTMKLYNPS